MQPSFILDLLFVLVAAIFIVIGIKRGLIKSLIHSAKIILSFVFAHMFGGLLGGFFKSSFLYGTVHDFVYKNVNDLYQNATAGVKAEELLQKLPDFMRTEEIVQAVNGISSGESGAELVEKVTHSVADPVSGAIGNVMGYICVFILSMIGLGVVAWILTKFVERIAFLGAFNHILGGVWGALLGAIVLLVLASAIKLFLGGNEVYTGTTIVRFFGDSGFLSAIRIFDVGASLFS